MPSIRAPRSAASSRLRSASGGLTSDAQALRLLLVQLHQLAAFAAGALEVGFARLRHHDFAQPLALGFVGDAHIDLARAFDEIERSLLRRLLRLLGLRAHLL